MDNVKQVVLQKPKEVGVLKLKNDCVIKLSNSNYGEFKGSSNSYMTVLDDKKDGLCNTI